MWDVIQILTKQRPSSVGSTLMHSAIQVINRMNPQDEYIKERLFIGDLDVRLTYLSRNQNTIETALEEVKAQADEAEKGVIKCVEKICEQQTFMTTSQQEVMDSQKEVMKQMELMTKKLLTENQQSENRMRTHVEDKMGEVKQEVKNKYDQDVQDLKRNVE